jgi:hypothetical protein
VFSPVGHRTRAHPALNNDSAGRPSEQGHFELILELTNPLPQRRGRQPNHARSRPEIQVFRRLDKAAKRLDIR